MDVIRFKRGDFLNISFGEKDVIPPKHKKLRNQLKSEQVSEVIVLAETESGNYTCVKCVDKPKSHAVEVSLGETRLYAYCHRTFEVDPDCLQFILHAEIDNKDEALRMIETRLAREADCRNKRIEQRKKRRKKEFSSGSFASSLSRRQISECLNGYEVVLLENTNRKAFRSKIHLINFECEDCRVCHKRLIPFVNAIPISEIEGIRVPGQYCSKCDAFWTSNGEDLKQVVEETTNPACCEFFTEYLIPDCLEVIQNSAEKLKSLSAVVYLKRRNSNDYTMALIVSSFAEQNPSKNTFHYKHLFARKLLFAIYSHQRLVERDGTEFEILKFSFSNKKENGFPDYMNVERIILRRGGGLYEYNSMHGSMLVDILLYSPFTNCFEIAHATHDPVLELYYMDAIIFREFISKYGNPGIKVAAHNCGYSDCFAMKEESFLYAYGYSVAQSAGLSEYSRQELLAEVMDLGYMSAHGILSLLNHNINMHPGVEYGNARDCWEADKRFVMNYNVNPQRFVVSTLGITPKTK